MEYTISATSHSGSDAHLLIKGSETPFGITPNHADDLPNPAELFLGAFAACILKNVERFSGILKFDYDEARLNVTATRLERPPRMDLIKFELTVFSKDSRLNTRLLQKNIERYGTIFNTVSASCEVEGTVVKSEDYE